MGYGLPAAIGACIGNDRQNVICIEGDGSIMMNLQELQTVKHHNFPIKIFIINNNGYASIKQTQMAFFKGAEYASGPNSGVTIPNFEKISNAFGIKYYKIEKNIELDIIKNILEEECAIICEIFTYPNEPFEPKVIAKGIDSNGKIIAGDLSDSYISETF
jgi:acetolactate synthase-1/2/3 large subunit